MATQIDTRPAGVLRRIDDVRKQLERDQLDNRKRLAELKRKPERGDERGDENVSQEIVKREHAIAAADKLDAYWAQTKQMFQEDPETIDTMGKIVDIHWHRRTSRAWRSAFLLNVAFLIAGWLLSLVATPANIFH